jgi:hypothetical protein
MKRFVPTKQALVAIMCGCITAACGERQSMLIVKVNGHKVRAHVRGIRHPEQRQPSLCSRAAAVQALKLGKESSQT